MWSAFMNGSGLYAGGGAGGGYVPSQGWEFVPCSRMERADRGKGKNRSPLRRISSPPTVFSQIYEQPFGAPEEPRSTTPSELRGQMWSGAEPQQQTQHIRLKKKFEELKKQHVQDKEEWMREKESLLREVANIQGGENRRILLDLKTVLEEVQVEVKREEEKRSELQLQYTRDRCSWELERAELKRRIAQLEGREGTCLAKSGPPTAAGLGAVALRSPQKYQDDTLRREREEQRRLLADTHSTAMDLRCRLEHNERDWLREKAELLERFDVERREWESQLKDMQRKIEELYCEVRAKREGTGLDSRKHYDDNITNRLSIHSIRTGSSLLSDNSRSETLSSSSQSEASRPTMFTGFGSNNKFSRDIDTPHHSAGFQGDSQSEYHVGVTHTDHMPVDELRREPIDTDELDSILQLHGCAESHKTAAKKNESVLKDPRENPAWNELNYGSEKKRNTTALNAALKEIARVSEELCSYQEEIRQKSGDKRMLSDLEERDMPLHYNEGPCDLSQIYDELRALEKEHWITLTPDNTLRSNTAASWKTTHPDDHKDPPVSPGTPSETDPAAPPIPPRSSSWNLSSHQEAELYIPESPMATTRKCHSPCIVADRKCSSPSIVRKFEAMLQENEGKVFVDGMMPKCSVPANSNCNVTCCHNRWSCDASKFTSKMSGYGTVQKSFSEVNIVTAAKNLSPEYSPGACNRKNQEVQQMPQTVRESPVDLHLSAPEIPASPNLHGSRRNIMLEQKTAEFNRCLFQAEMGRGVEEQYTFTPVNPSPVVCQQVLLASSESLLPWENQLKPPCSDVSTCIIEPELTDAFSTSDITKQSPAAPAQTRCSLRGHEFRMEQDEPPSKEIHVALWEDTTNATQRLECHSEVMHSSSRKTHIKETTEVYCSVPENRQTGTNEDDCVLEEKSQLAKTGLSLQQPFTENKQKSASGQQAPPKHVSDSCRPGLRMMNDHPWKPLTLAAYPRPEGSRSNYGAVERILKNYETAAKNMNQQQREMASSPDLSVRQKSDKHLDMLDMDIVPTPLFIRETLPSQAKQTSTHKILELKEIQLTAVQKTQESSMSTVLNQKSFSRPARPANRRLPSRWASRSPFSSFSTSSTPAPPSFRLQNNSSFTYSHAFHMESVII